MRETVPEGMIDQRSDLLAELMDRQRICDVIHRYCRATDRLDADLFRTTFWEDGGFDGGPAEGPALNIIPSLLDGVVRDMWATSHHSVSNILIELADDRAFVETYLTAFHMSHPTHESRAALIGEQNALRAGFTGGDVIEFIFGGRYIDMFERRGGEWRIFRRRIVPDWNRVAPYSGIATGGQYDLLLHRPRRDRGDPVYMR
ncbi:nuclear transport factor 2 family protein [Sphingobium sp.]|uniref:nuclear transport factor 2 family protein n=1 Tax=Sphingobium sp. TaxID=1912891 RepID=UPI002BA95832|nr:nuclear transport factor 2 family protein [Sphingobium sp.]HUD92952.1 nuclear transport factor 2 family protein [Sphingobium sp.]